MVESRIDVVVHQGAAYAAAQAAALEQEIYKLNEDESTRVNQIENENDNNDNIISGSSSYDMLHNNDSHETTKLEQGPSTSNQFSLFDFVPFAEDCLASLAELDLNSKRSEVAIRLVSEYQEESDESAQTNTDNYGNNTHNVEEEVKQETNNDKQEEVDETELAFAEARRQMISLRENLSSGQNPTHVSTITPSITADDPKVTTSSSQFGGMESNACLTPPPAPAVRMSPISTNSPMRRIYQLPFKESDLYFGTETGFLVEHPAYSSSIISEGVDPALGAKFIPHEGLRWSSVEFVLQCPDSNCRFNKSSQVPQYRQKEEDGENEENVEKASSKCDCEQLMHQIYTGADPILLPQDTPDPRYFPILPLFLKSKPSIEEHNELSLNKRKLSTTYGIVLDKSASMFSHLVEASTMLTGPRTPTQTRPRSPSLSQCMVTPVMAYSPSPAASAVMGVFPRMPRKIDVGDAAAASKEYEVVGDVNATEDSRGGYQNFSEASMPIHASSQSMDGKDIVIYLHGYFFLLRGCAEVEAQQSDSSVSNLSNQPIELDEQTTMDGLTNAIRLNQQELWFNESWNAHVSFANSLLATSRLTLGRYLYPPLDNTLVNLEHIIYPNLVPKPHDFGVKGSTEPLVCEVSLTLGERPLVSSLLLGLKYVLPFILPRLKTIPDVLKFLRPETEAGTSGEDNESCDIQQLMSHQFLGNPFFYSQQTDVYDRTQLAMLFTKPLWESAPGPDKFPSGNVSNRLQPLWLTNCGNLESNLPLPPPLVNLIPRLSSILANLHWQIGVQCGKFARISMEAYSTSGENAECEDLDVGTGSKEAVEVEEAHPDIVVRGGANEVEGGSFLDGQTTSNSFEMHGSNGELQEQSPPLADIFKVLCPEAVLKAYPFVTNLLVAPHRYLPLCPLQDVPSRDQQSTANTEFDRGDTSPLFRQFDAIRFSFIEDAVSELEKSLEQLIACRSLKKQTDMDCNVVEMSCVLAAFNLSLRQLLVLGFDTAVEDAADYFASQGATLQEPLRALINLCLIASSKRAIS